MEDALQLMMELEEEGCSLRRIAQELNKAGFDKNGKSWTHNMVYGALEKAKKRDLSGEGKCAGCESYSPITDWCGEIGAEASRLTTCPRALWANRKDKTDKQDIPDNTDESLSHDMTDKYADNAAYTIADKSDAQPVTDIPDIADASEVSDKSDIPCSGEPTDIADTTATGKLPDITDKSDVGGAPYMTDISDITFAELEPAVKVVANTALKNISKGSIPAKWKEQITEMMRSEIEEAMSRQTSQTLHAEQVELPPPAPDKVKKGNRLVLPGCRGQLASTVDAGIMAALDKWKVDHRMSLADILDAALWNFLGKPRMSYQYPEEELPRLRKYERKTTTKKGK